MKHQTMAWLLPRIAALAMMVLGGIGAAMAATIPGKVIYSGVSFGFVGQGLEGGLTAMTAAGVVQTQGQWTWAMTNATTKELVAAGDSAGVWYVPPAAGVWLLTAKFVLADQPVNPELQGYKAGDVITSTLRLQTTLPSKPLVKITGPARAAQMQGQWIYAEATPAFNIANAGLGLVGQFVLPDGTTVPAVKDEVTGKYTLRWYPGQGTAGPTTLPVGSLQKITFQAYYEGYQSQTMASAVLTEKVWTYKFPTFRMTKVVSATAAPANVRLTVVADDPGALSSLDGLSYEWTLPAGLTPVGTPGSGLNGKLYFGGTYPVSVRVQDYRGNSQILETSLTVADPAPVKVTLTAAKVQKWSHAPVTLNLLAKTTGGTPGDPVQSIKFYVDDILQPNVTATTAKVNIDTAGAHVLSAVATTVAGASTNTQLAVNVPEPDVPTCTLTSTPPNTLGVMGFKAACTSTTGFVTSYRWSYGDTLLPIRTPSIAYKVIPSSSTKPPLVMTATTDGNQSTTLYFNDWPF